MAFITSASLGGAVPDATTNFTAMDRLIDFLTGVTGTLPAIQQWVVNLDDTATVPGERHVYLQGPGLSGTDAIYVVIRVYDIVGPDVRNWEILGCTGFNPASAYNAQPGGSTIRSYLTLNDDVDMPFWFFANGRRFICVFNVVNTYHACTAGFFLPYGPPAEYPYPMFCGGSAERENIRWSNATYNIGNFYDGPLGSSTASCAHIRHVDGTWLRVGSYNQSNSTTRPITNLAACRLSFFSERPIFDMDIMASVGGGYPLFPVTIFTPENGGVVYGELDGVCWTSPRDNTTESTITDGGDEFLVIQNTYRSEEPNCAILQA